VHQAVDSVLPFYVLLGKSEEQKEQLKQDAINQWLEILYTMVEQVLSNPLKQPDGQTAPVLKETLGQQRLVEMEFLIPMASLHCGRVNQIIQHDPLTKHASQLLNFSQVQGMLKGFIDLTFEWQGKYYVLDWKSNYLGEDESFYTQDAMKQAMLDHRYDFQYQLYTLALHRYLKVRIPDYDYDQHIGGAYYVFLRGISGNDSSALSDVETMQNSNGVFFTKPDRSMIEALDALFQGDTALPLDTEEAEPNPEAEPEPVVSDPMPQDKTSTGIVSTSGDQGELF